MIEEESADTPRDLDGLSLDSAVDAVADESTPGELRETLAIVAQDGVVSRAAIEERVANASMVATTAETRVELAADKLSSARETAAPVSDLAFVAGRVQNFEARLSHIQDRADELGAAIQDVLAMKETGDLYEIAQRIRRVTTAATEVQRAADDFQLEIDAFEEWLTDPRRRVEELTDDIDALADSVSELDDVVDSIGTDVGDSEGDDESDGYGDGDPGRDPAARWAAATVRHRVVSLMITDLRAELAAVRTWAEREDATPPSGIEPRLDEIQATHEDLGDRLTALADSEWTARFDEQLTALDAALEEMEPPVVWADVEAVVSEHRPEVE